MTNWLILTATLPTHPSALRVRVWRALKASGAGTLREGVYVLPVHAPTAPALWEIERTINTAGASAHMLQVQARDEAQEQVFRALFDRADLYGELLLALKEFRSGLKAASETTLRKGLRDLEQQLQAIASSDFFPGKAGERAAQALAALRREVDLRLSPGEPEPASAIIERQSIDDYQGRTWATRKRPWVDRLATAWLVQRFIDRSPTFLWIDEPARCPRKALGYDFDGARFTHVGQRVTFEVVAATFGLDDDPALQGVGRLVHTIDVGGSVLDEAAGFELIVRGLQQQHANDDALLAAAVGLFDTLYVAMGSRP
jgi:hypothetical protein